MVITQRGDIVWVNLDPTLGSEIRKSRPAVVVSNDAANRRYNQITVVPLTSRNVGSVEPFQVFVGREESGLSKDSKVLAEQIRTVSKLRLGQRTGRLRMETIKKVETAIKIHLDLE